MNSNEWIEVRFSEIMSIIGGGTPKTKIEEYWNGNIPWLSVKDFNSEIRTVYTTEKNITELGLEKSSTKMLNKGDLIIPARGTVGALAQLGREMTFNQSCYGLRANELTNNNFLYYLLKYKIKMIQRSTHGSVFDTITKDTFDTLIAKIPSIEEQKAIAKILSDLDNKIEVNNKINKRLEEMAQAIFKQWFVDFEFPNEEGNPYKSSGGEMVESELGMIPNGWESKNLGSIGTVITGKTPSSKDADGFGDEYNFITPRDISNSTFILDTERLLSSVGAVKLTKNKIYKNSIGVSCIGSNLGEVYITGEDSFTNQQINSILLGDKTLYPYVYIYLKNMKTDFLNMSSGSAVPIINKTSFSSINILVPPEKILSKFVEVVTGNFEMIKCNIKEINKLTNLRDTLLPKLMSGEIRVPLK